MSKHLLTLGAALMTLTGCGTSSSCNEGVSQLQLRERQTCTFESCDVPTAMKAMIDVLQDEGFIVNNAVLDLGLITGEKQIEVEDAPRDLPHWSFATEDKRHAQGLLVVSANVSEFGVETRVRVNFQIKKYDAKGNLTEVNRPLIDKYYQSFFAKLSKGIFYQTENI